MKIILGFVFMFLSVAVLGQNQVNKDFADKNITGFKILEIEPGSVYEKLGLKKGDIIKKFNGKVVKEADSVKELFKNIKETDQVDILIERNKKEIIYRYTIK